MLKRDKDVFMALVSGDNDQVRAALLELSARESGHFEDHPISRKLVKEHLAQLVELWHLNPVDGCRDWALQFVADSGLSEPAVKPLILAALADPMCAFLPTVLYLMSTQPLLYEDVGSLLIPLTKHADEQVRWRVAYFAAQLKSRSADIRAAIDALRSDPFDLTKIYVRQCDEA